MPVAASLVPVFFVLVPRLVVAFVVTPTRLPPSQLYTLSALYTIPSWSAVASIRQKTPLQISCPPLQAQTMEEPEPPSNDDDDSRPSSPDVPTKHPTKFHYYTICMVPPEANQQTWKDLTKARTELRDPGLFRWPPHANLLYPFIDPHRPLLTNKDTTAEHNTTILEQLSQVCRKMEPFEVRLERLGTFGGSKRGVLWMYPTSFASDSPPSNNDNNRTEPLIELQGLLQKAFPYCNDQQKVSGTFNPHMTLSHFVNLDDARQAQAQIESWWDTSTTFAVNEIYLLHRKGDDGQFERLATLGLGRNGSVTVHEPSLPFDGMPREEADWVREERMKMKRRRNGRGRRGRRRSSPDRPPPDSPEVIARKRAERKAKREAMEQEKVGDVDDSLGSA